MARRKLSRNEKIFYAISLVIIFSMVFGTFASLIAPGS
jgi:cell division protein FtsL